mmetsp:Transcript_128532/g.320551  ORF Transcript_128532/g.320551 Transcript_128532/m.320551 type:complete len:86 (-) Transcript_128532:108-365(-)
MTADFLTAPPPEDSEGPTTIVRSHSIMSGRSGRENRTDTHGNSIQPGSKAHRCSFRDESRIADVVEVQQYKNPHSGSDFDNQKQV